MTASRDDPTYDPLGDLGGANVYAYVGNNPTNFTDYLGLASASCRPGEPCHSGVSSGGSDPWSPEPTGSEESDRRPCPHGSRGAGELGTYLPPVSIELLIAMLERDRLERQRLAVFLSEYEGYWFGSPELVRLWFEAYKAIRNRDSARFREIFRRFVDAWFNAYWERLAADPYSFSSTRVHGLARETWRMVHSDETLAGMSDTRIAVEATTVSFVAGPVLYFGGKWVIVRLWTVPPPDWEDFDPANPPLAPRTPRPPYDDNPDFGPDMPPPVPGGIPGDLPPWPPPLDPFHFN